MFDGSRTGGWKIWESYASNYVQCTLYKNEINTSFFNRYFHIAFIVRRILSRVCIIGPIFFIADNDNNFEFIGDTDNNNYRR